jgi:hypothetical protein
VLCSELLRFQATVTRTCDSNIDEVLGDETNLETDVRSAKYPFVELVEQAVAAPAE